MSTRLWSGVFHSPTPSVSAKANLFLRVEWGGVLGEKCPWPDEAASQQGFVCWRVLLPCSVHFAAVIHASIWSGSKYKGKEKPVCKKKTNISCHQWSEQCYKSLLTHRMSTLRMFSFSLKPCVTGREGCLLCSCPLASGKPGQVCPFSSPDPISWQNNQTIQKYWHCWGSLQRNNLVLEEEENERRQWMEWCFQRNPCGLGTALTDHV